MRHEQRRRCRTPAPPLSTNIAYATSRRRRRRTPRVREADEPESRYASNDAHGYSPVASAAAAFGAISSSANRRSACAALRARAREEARHRRLRPIREGRLHVGHTRVERAGREPQHLERDRIADRAHGLVVVVRVVDRLGAQLDELGRREP
jgi:hypothetical protein